MKKDGQKGETLLLIEKREKGEKICKERTAEVKGKRAKSLGGRIERCRVGK